ncbi:MAG: hemoblobin-interacting domain-containing protein [Dethiobacteria bacterium]|jgi:parallel beta-helix repeat protein
MFLKKNKWKKIVTIFMVLNLLLGFSSFLTLGTAMASEEVVFTVEINDVETASYTMADLKAMPATTRSYSNGFYEYTGVDFIYLLESLDIDYHNWTIKLVSGGSSYVLDSPKLTDPLLAYEEKGIPFFPPNQLRYFWGDNHKNIYQYVAGIEVIKPELLAPPALAADSTENTVGNSIELTFADDETWRDAITEVTVDDIAVASNKYTLAAGKLTIDASVFTAAGDYAIVVKATGYEDATVTQALTAVGPGTWYVDGSGSADFVSIQAAVTAAGDGDNIIVKDGTYTENVMVDKALTIRSENGAPSTTVISAVSTTPVFDVDASGVVIDGFSVQGSTGKNVAGIELVGVSDCTIQNNDCSGCYNGIHLGGAATNNIVTGNHCYGNSKRGISIRDTAHDNFISRNTVENNTEAGFCIKDQSKDNVLWLNNIIGNSVEIMTANTYKSPEPLTYTYKGGSYTGYLGNYWDNYTGIDANGDGIGDTPYISGAISDDYPLIGQWHDGTITAPAAATYVVTFAVKDGENAIEGAAIEVKDSAGEVVVPEEDGTYELEAGDYTYTVTREGYKEATGAFTVVSEAVTINVVLEKEAVGEIPPALTASDQGNTAGNPVVIKYPYEYPPVWENAITAVIVDGTELERWQYNVGFGKLIIAAGIFNEVKDYMVTVKATGYQDATVIQKIEARPELFVSEGKGNMVYVAGKRDHTVAIKNDGTVWAWGNGQSGKLGDGTTGSNNWRSVPGQVSDLTEVIAVAPGENHTLALKSDDTVWAWGSNSYGVLGNENISGSSSVPVQVITDSETGTALTDIQAIAAGDVHSLALKNDGTVWAWGSKMYGQLGDGESSWTSCKVPVQVITDSETGAALTDIQAIAAGDVHSLALKNDGTVWAWGRNYYGQLGSGQDRSSLEESAVAVQVITDLESGTALADVKAIAAGQGQSFALKNDGTVWAWGWNGNAQLGNGSTVDSSVPVQVARLMDIQAITAGANHVMALKDDGTLWAWGNNNYGQLGIGADVTSYIPTQLCAASDITMINAGYYHSLAVKNDGTVWAWGENKNGKLGDGTTERNPYPPEKREVPTQVKLAPQALVPAVESVILGNAVELDFTDDVAWRESITIVSVDDTDLAGEQYTVVDGKITIAADIFAETKEYTITIKADGFLDAVVTQQVQPQPPYDVVPVEDAAYTIGETADGIKTMTVNPNQTGLKYFAVTIESTEAHEGTETVVFTHLEDDIQLQLNALEADFDEISAAKAGFNVNPGDVIKVYIVDQLTNNPDSNPLVLQ